MTTANKITIGRILMVPLFITAVLLYAKRGDIAYRMLALIFFLVASVSDAVDGYIARKFNQRSELGTILDPLADKLLLVSGAILLSVGLLDLPTIPLAFIITILAREVLILLGVILIFYTCDQVKVRPRWAGKLATLLQMVTILWCLMDLPLSQIRCMAYLSAGFTAISAIYYVTDGICQLNASPASAPRSDKNNLLR